MGLDKDDERPMGVASYRAYYKNRGHNDDWLEIPGECVTQTSPTAAAATAIFGMGDGTSNIGLASSTLVGVRQRGLLFFLFAKICAAGA